MADRKQRAFRTLPSLSLALAFLVGGACGEFGAESELRAEERDSSGAPALAGRPEVAVGRAGALELERSSRAALHGSWNARMDAIIARHTEEGIRYTGGKARASDFEVSVHVLDLESGVELGSRAPDVVRIPASNMKLVTTAAALVLLGPSQEFLTPVEALGPIERGVLRGDLVLRAAGDPIAPRAEDARVESRLDAIAMALRERGITRIEGAVILDEGGFQDPGPAPGWPAASQYWQEHCALAGGFSINGGVLQARVQPSKTGGKAGIEVHPAPHGLRSNYGVASEGNKLDVRVGATRTSVTVKGKIPRAQPLFTAEFSHPDPVALFGAVLLERLGARGIAVDGGLRRERGVREGEPIAELRSSLDAVLVPINTYSRNSVADQLFLALGHAVSGEGTWAAGEQASLRAMAELGVDPSGFRQGDGSGLSRENRVSARQLSSLIRAVLRRDAATREVFLASLAKSGAPGTLEERLDDEDCAGRVWAKNGWIGGASSLSGVCATLDGRELVFSILIEYPAQLGGLNRVCFKPLQDALVSELIRAAP